MQVKNWSKIISSKYDAPDLIINNAGIVHELASLWEIEGKIFDRVIDININC